MSMQLLPPIFPSRLATPLGKHFFRRLSRRHAQRAALFATRLAPVFRWATNTGRQLRSAVEVSTTTSCLVRSWNTPIARCQVRAPEHSAEGRDFGGGQRGPVPQGQYTVFQVLEVLTFLSSSCVIIIKVLGVYIRWSITSNGRCPEL